MVAPSTHLKLAFAWITYVSSLSADKLRPIMSDNFLSRIQPASLGFPDTGKEAYLTQLVKAPIITYNISLPREDDIVEGKNGVQFYTTANGLTTHGIRWKNEYHFSFTFENNKILRVTEFSDSITDLNLLSKEAAAAEAQLNCKGGHGH